jgi:hypothetical protein
MAVALAHCMKHETDLVLFNQVRETGVLEALVLLVSETTPHELLTSVLKCIYLATKFRM